MSGSEARFDWYSATFEDLDDGRIPAALAVSLGASVTWGRGRLGYAQCATIERDDETLARVFVGCASRPGEVHIATSGDACDRVVPLVRRLWPNHRVARADSAVDFSADFDVIDGAALEFAETHRLSYRMVTDSDGGATRYLGSPSSDVTVRVYKKSEQLRKAHPDQAADIPDGVVRIELQARPKSVVKAVVASMTADDLWGLGKWTKDFAAVFLDLDVVRIQTHFWQPSDWAQSLHWLGHQYGPGSRRRIEQVGLEVARAEVLQALGMGDLVTVGGDDDGRH